MTQGAAAADAAQSHNPEILSQFSRSFETVLDHNRLLLEGFSRFVQDESRRFATLRLERAGQTLEKLNDCRGVAGLIGAQREWLTDLMQDYSAHGMRYSEMLRAVSVSALGSETAAGREILQTAEDTAENIAEEARQMADAADGDDATRVAQEWHDESGN